MAAGLRFGPDPSTHPRCTIGGMIGNNACGSRALGYGRTDDNVVALRLLTAAGDVLETGYDAAGAAWSRGADATVAAPGRRWRRTSPWPAPSSAASAGRSPATPLQHLLPESGSTSPGSWSGQRGDPRGRDRGDGPARRRPAAPRRGRARVRRHRRRRRGRARCRRARPERLRGARPSARRHPRRAPRPRRRAAAAARRGVALGRAVRRRTEADVRDRGATARRRRPSAWTRSSSRDPATQAALWRIREDGAGLAGRGAVGRARLARLGGRRRAARAARRVPRATSTHSLSQHGLTAAPYGHFGDGCLHVRLDFPLGRPDGRGALPRVPHRRRRAGRPVRRVAVRRARRRPGPQRAARRGCTRPRRSRCSARSSGPSTRRPAQPRRARRPGADRRRPALDGVKPLRRSATARSARLPARRRRLPGAAPLHRRRQVPGRQRRRGAA